jgi:hypothetical protein
LEELKDILEKCSYNPLDSTLILVGDLVNKGPFSAEVVQYVRSLNALCVRGNHDDTVLSHVLKTSSKPKDDSYSYIDKLSRYIEASLSVIIFDFLKLGCFCSFDSEDIDWLLNLPYTIEIPSLNAIVVHAGLVPGVEVVDQLQENLVTVRNVIESNKGKS